MKKIIKNYGENKLCRKLCKKKNCAENCAKMIGGTLKIVENRKLCRKSIRQNKIVENRKWNFPIHVQQPKLIGEGNLLEEQNMKKSDWN
jgi:hypothetical protein